MFLITLTYFNSYKAPTLILVVNMEDGGLKVLPPPVTVFDQLLRFSSIRK